jgi:ornithine cyclodeaminase
VNVSVPERSAAFSIKAGVNSKGGVVGLKVGTYWPNNEREFGIPNHASTTLLLDPASGRMRSLLNTSSLNGLRTAAANALATSVLARDDASVLFVAGAGHQARYEIRALCDVRRFQRIVIWSRNRRHAEALALEYADLPGVEFSVVDAADSGAQQADVIVTVTASRRPLFSAQSVRSGTHISAMGADMQGKQELDPDCLLTARLVADWPPQSVSVGEFQHVGNTGARSVDEIVALGDILAGRKPGRLRSDEVTVFDSSGVAIQDLEIADNVLNSAARNGRGQWIEF